MLSKQYTKDRYYKFIFVNGYTKFKLNFTSKEILLKDMHRNWNKKSWAILEYKLLHKYKNKKLIQQLLIFMHQIYYRNVSDFLYCTANKK